MRALKVRAVNAFLELPIPSLADSFLIQVLVYEFQS